MLSIAHEMETMKVLAESGQITSAGAVGIGIRQKLLDAGEDTTVWESVLTGLKASPEDGIQYLTEALGAIKPKVESLMILSGKMPAQPEIVKGGDVTQQGQIIRIVNGVPTATNVKDFVAGPKDDPKLSQFGLVGEGGKITSIQGDDRGNFYGLGGKPIKLKDSDRLIESTVLTGDESAIGLGRAEMEKLRDSEVSVKTFLATAGDTLKILETSPDINTFTAAAAGLVNNFQQEAKAIANSLGADIDVSFLDPATHAATFDSLGIKNQQMRGLITSMAFQAAAASGQSGRDITEKDFQRFLAEIGGNASDPRAFAQSVKDVATRVDRGFRINHEVRLGRKFEGDLGLGALNIGAGQSSGVSSLTDDELFQ